MRKVGIIIFAIALVIGLVAANLFSFGRMSACNLKFSFGIGPGVRGSGNVITEKRQISDFTGIETGGIFQVTVVAQKEFGLEVEADDNLLPLIRTEVRDGVLRIDSDSKFKSSNPVRIRISAPDIDRLDASGVSNVSLSNVSNSDIEIHVSGASKVNVSGETERINLDISGASKVNAEELKAKSAVIDASGACQATVNVTDEIRSDLSGASKVVYLGSPASVVTKRSGVSSIIAK